MTVNQATLKAGDKIKAVENVYRLKKGQLYTVSKPKGDSGYIELEGDDNGGSGFMPRRFESAPVFKEGDRVKITGEFKLSPWLAGHGEEMDADIGKFGTVLGIDRDNDVRVQIDGGTFWYYNPWDLSPSLEPHRKDIVAYGSLQTLGNAKKVTLVSTRGAGEFYLLGYIDGDEEIHAWNAKGDTPPGTHYRKIENVPPAKPKQVFVYINVYKKGDALEEGNNFKTRAVADRAALEGRVGCIKVELKEVFND